MDERGIPLSIVVTAANCNDCAQLAVLLEAKVVRAEEGPKEHLCLDAGYVGTHETAQQAGYVPRIRPRGEERAMKKKNLRFKPWRRVVELSHSWFNRFRKLSPRYEKTTRSYLGLVMLAATMIVLNKAFIIYG